MEKNTEQIIATLAEKMGTSVEHLWGVLVKQAPITATIHLSYFIFFGIFLVVGSVWTWFRYKADDKDGRNIDWLPFPCVILGVVGVVYVCALFSEIPNIVTAYINPEYWAIKQVLTSFK